MKNVLLILALFLLSTCRSKNIDLHQLLELDSKIREVKVLNQFTSLKVSRKSINYIKVCESKKYICDDDEAELKMVLSDLKIDLDFFRLTSSKMSILGLSGYYFENGYSLWVEGGAFGDMYGYAIKHEKETKVTEKFKVNNRYTIRIGKKIKENLYYFRAN